MIGGDRLLYPPRFSKVHVYSERDASAVAAGVISLFADSINFRNGVCAIYWTCFPPIGPALGTLPLRIYIYIYIRLLEVVLALLFFSFFSTFIYFSYRALLLFNRAVNGFLNGTKIILRGVAGDGKIIIPLKFRFRRFSFFLLILSEYGTTNERWKKYYENCKISWESGKRTVWTNSLNRVMIIIIIIIIHKLHSLWKNSPG